MTPLYEYVPDFLTPGETAELLRTLEQQRGLLLETGQCDRGKPTHATIQWGSLRQAYLSCVPVHYRVKSSGGIPEFLADLKARLETRYNAYFDNIQVNKHFSEDSYVPTHRDSPPGHIVMVSLGAERRFKLAVGMYKPLADLKLASGSLLTFFPKTHILHTMPKSKTPCGARYSLIFRYITKAIATPGAIDDQTAAERRKRNAKRDAEYNAVQAAFRSGGYAAVEECLRQLDAQAAL